MGREITTEGLHSGITQKIIIIIIIIIKEFFFSPAGNVSKMSEQLLPHPLNASLAPSAALISATAALINVN